jgi:type III restriction enzyme
MVIQKINTIEIPDYVIEASSHLLHQISEAGKKDTYLGGESIKQKAIFTPLDIIEELSENTGMSYITLFKIVTQLKNLNQLIKNPPRFIHEASVILKNTELDEMLRSITYETNGETYEFDFNDFEKNIDPTKYVETPNKGVFDKMLIDSLPERNFSLDADKDTEVVCFLKLPSYYKIKTPIGDYEPDFGLVLKRKQLKDGAEQEYYFVIETKGTNSIDDKKALSESEIYKIKCALQHFKAIGIDVHYKAPIEEFSYFKKEAEITMNNK